MLVLAQAASAQFAQQGTKLVATDAVGLAGQGTGVAASSDGSTVLIGALTDNANAGAAWVFTRSAGVWKQQGLKLVGSDATGSAQQGTAVALSADGNTALIGGYNDNSLVGAAWVFTRSGTTWSQQGSKLVASDAVGYAELGHAVAISADGNTAIVGGPTDNSFIGAAWIFTRDSSGAWTQQGNKLVGTGAVGNNIGQGISVAISGDGNTAIVGGPNDNLTTGAVWVFTRSNGTWTQQGGKLVGSGAVGTAGQGAAIALSSDGNTAIVGGYNDNTKAGAAWVWTRNGGSWSQQGAKLVGTGAVGAAYQGISVALSADGNTAIVGGDADASRVGAAWIFTRSGGTWTQLQSKLVGTGAVGTALQGTSVALSSDASTAFVGGPGDALSAGAVWVFAAGGCAAPTVAVQPQSQIVQIGQSATLSVVGTGAAPLSYQWYQGASGDTSVPVGSNAITFTTPALTVATSYWVRVSNSCGHADSTTATVAITTCAAPAIAIQPQSQTLASGQSATLSVTATGATPLSYQWYQGASGNTSQPVGGNASSFITPALNATTSYWVRVSNTCDHADSGTATVTVAATGYVSWVPVASHSSGLNQSQWRSDLGLLNPASVAANVQLSFYGASVVTSTTYVPAGAQSILVDVINQLSASGSGAIQISSDQPLKVTARSYNQVSSGAACNANGTQGQDYPAVSGVSGLSAGQIAYLPGLAENATYRCNIGLVNTGPTSAAVLVELFNGAGTKLADYPVTLNPGQWSQDTQPFKNRAAQTAMDRGYAKLTVQSGSGVYGFASVIDNITNDPTTITMQP
jgi:hypothetical protein